MADIFLGILTPALLLLCGTQPVLLSRSFTATRESPFVFSLDPQHSACEQF
jgi:hypothetical protein